MPIKEQPMQLEFIYEPPVGQETGKCQIYFFYKDEIPFIKIKELDEKDQEPWIVPVNFIMEITDYLRSKGAILPVESTTQAVSEVAIPITKITKKDDKKESIIDQTVKLTAIPVTSFDVKEDSSENEKKKSSLKEGKILLDGEEIKDNSIKKRPVIKAKTVKDSALIRKEKEEKKIKRVTD